MAFYNVGEHGFVHKASRKYVVVEQKPAKVDNVRMGEYSNRQGKKSAMATVSAESKSQIRKWCRQNDFRPQQYEKAGNWTALCRRAMPKDQEGPEDELGLALDKEKRRSKMIHGV